MTIKDVAEEAGVSIATVSRVLNNKSVRKESKIRVDKAIAKLNFVPNALARGLMQKKTKTIGTLITSMTNTYYMEITEVIEKRLWDLESMLFLSTTDGNHKQERSYLESLVSRQVDGIIIIDPSIENYRNGLYSEISRRLPLVLVHSFREISNINSVVIDQHKGMEKVMNYLWDLGHRRIAFLRGFRGYSYDVKEKCWRDFLKEKGLSPSPDELISISEGNTDNAIKLAANASSRILSLPRDRRPSAVFACNDLMALGVLSAAHSLGLKIPEDLSIIGHDNTNLTLSSMPPLTTVDLKLPLLGNGSIDLLMNALDSDNSGTRQIFIEPELVVRASSGGCRT